MRPDVVMSDSRGSGKLLFAALVLDGLFAEPAP
jgi:hypothetical protein